MSPGVILADAEYGADSAFRAGLSTLGLAYIVGVQPTLSVWRPGEEPLAPKPWSGKGRPALHDPNTRFYLRLVAGLARPGWQDGGVVVPDQLRVGAVDLRIVEGGLDHRHLGVDRRLVGPSRADRIVLGPDDGAAREHMGDRGHAGVLSARRGQEMSRPYDTDLSDGQWALIAPMIPEAEPRGRPRKAATRELVNAILYFLRAGAAWRLLPHDLPPWQTV